MSKKRILMLADMVCATGFGNVAGNIMRRINATGRFEFDGVGINADGSPFDLNEWPGRIWPAMNALNPKYRDLYGRQLFIDLLQQGDYDLVFIIQDTFIVETFVNQMNEVIGMKEKQPKTIYYFPIDAPPKKTWVETVSKFDVPVAYTQYAKDECIKWMSELEDKLHVIHHGNDFGRIYKMDEDLTEFRHIYYQGGADDKFIILNVNRNQARKDIGRSFMILNELRRRGRDKAYLYMHMAQQDVGGDLASMADLFGFEFGKDWACPANFNPQTGVSLDLLNRIYNMADCFLTTTLGEGFSITPIESSGAKLPMVLPENTCLTELYADNRAFLVPAGDNPSAWIMKENDNERLRPLMNVEKAADAIERIMDGDLPDVEGAYQWAKEHDWDIICQDWIRVFDEAQPTIVKPKPQVPSQANRAERRRLERQQKRETKSYA